MWDGINLENVLIVYDMGGEAQPVFKCIFILKPVK